MAHNAVAEMKYLLRLGIPPPSRWFDTFVARRYLTNRPNSLEAGLSLALHELGLARLAPAMKETFQEEILALQFDPECAADRGAIIEYCFSDCDGCAALFGKVGELVDPALMSHWVEYLKAVARMELLGTAFDVETYDDILANKPSIREIVAREVNRTYPVIHGQSLDRKSFLRWCRTVGIEWPATASPRTGKPFPSFADDVMKNMEPRHPFIGQVRQALKTLKHLDDRSLVVDPSTRRHYFSTCPFRSVTGRNQPRNFVFNGPKWMRSLITPESPDHVLVYVDYVAQEVGIAAALSDDPAMRSVYASSDCHMAFAIRAGAAPAGATTQSHAAVRKQYKTVNLGVLYGQTGHGMAARLGIGRREADALLQGHRAMFPTFWKWSDRIVQGSFDRGWIITPCGWRSAVPQGSNERTWMNWPMQATGGDIMRLTVTYLDRQGVRILAPVHDGFLLSCRRDQVDDLRRAVDYACSMAVEHVLPGFPMRWEFTIHDGGRFGDEDGRPLWDQLQRIFEEAHYVTA